MSQFERAAPRASSTEIPQDPRLLSLSEEQRRQYQQAQKLRNDHIDELPLSKEDRAQQDALWHELALEFLGGELPALETFVENVDSFPKDRYAISRLISLYPFAHDPRQPYEKRDGGAREPLSGRSINLDAPLGYALMYRRTDTKKIPADKINGRIVYKEVTEDVWEPISVVGFAPDLQSQVLLVDQVQGGSTSADLTTKPGRRARMKFKQQPEIILYDLVKELGRKIKMRGIGIRKPERNMWPNVRNAGAAGRKTLYKSLARDMGLRKFASGDYYLEPVNRPEAISPDRSFLFP